MPLVICETSDGLRASEVTAIVRDFYGKRHFIPVDRDFLSKEGKNSYMPVGLLRINEAEEAALVQLPVEADSGANRLWVKRADLLKSKETRV
jgi:hypothetical protein